MSGPTDTAGERHVDERHVDERQTDERQTDERQADEQSADERREIEELGPWFHNLHLPNGLQTAPDHWLGDFPRFKWDQLKRAVPEDLSGWTVLDVGCNAGFYSFELARRGAKVLGLDHDPRYLAQARWAAARLGLEDRVRFERRHVYELAHVTDRYDLVMFMGVLYHLRYPLLGLDLVARLAQRLLVFQTLTMPGGELREDHYDVPFAERSALLDEGWPKMAFVRDRFAGDPTNWWIPNHAGVVAMLHSIGMEVAQRPSEETYVCRPDRQATSWRAGELRAVLRAMGAPHADAPDEDDDPA